MNLGTLLSGLIEPLPERCSSVNITGIATDSRRVRSGYLFAALPGTQSDGKAYVGDAIRRGAVAVIGGMDLKDSGYSDQAALIFRTPDPRLTLSRISARFFHHPSQQLTVIGVTGTNGKTTTTFIIQDLLTSLGRTCGVIGTTGARFGELEFDTGNTTPEAPTLHDVLRKMLDAGATYVVMEVSSHALEWHRVADVVFRAAVFTNLTQDHLDFHREMDTYFVAKRRLFRLLADSAASSGRRAPAVINTDDLYGRKILSYLSEYPGVKPFSYGLSESADIRGVINDLTVHGTTFDILTPTGACQTRCPIPGRHNVLNALAAVGTLYGLGFSLEKLCASLPMIHSVPGRMETVQSGQPFLVIVDYAHTPDALENLLDALKNITRGRLITVFGCGGDRDRSKRPKMGRAVSDRSDVTIVTSDNPRTEKPEDIIADILPGLVDGCVYEIIPDRRSAIRKAINLALEGDTVVIAGKGHETYQIIGKTSIPFDDRAEAGKALALRGFDK